MAETSRGTQTTAGAKHISSFESLAQKYKFQILREGDIYKLCAENINHEWVPWINFYPELNLVSYCGKTDFLNIWLCDTRMDFTPEKCMYFVRDLNAALDLSVDNRFLVRTLIDSKDWQKIAQVSNAHADKRYLSCGILEPDQLADNTKPSFSERIQSASSCATTSQLTHGTKNKISSPEH